MYFLVSCQARLSTAFLQNSSFFQIIFHYGHVGEATANLFINPIGYYMKRRGELLAPAVVPSVIVG